MSTWEEVVSTNRDPTEHLKALPLTWSEQLCLPYGVLMSHHYWQPSAILRALPRCPRALGTRWPSEGLSPGRSPDALVVKAKMGTLDMRFSDMPHLTCGPFSLVHSSVSWHHKPMPFHSVPSRRSKCDCKEDIAFHCHCFSLGHSHRWRAETLDTFLCEVWALRHNMANSLLC